MKVFVEESGEQLVLQEGFWPSKHLRCRAWLKIPPTGERVRERESSNIARMEVIGTTNENTTAEPSSEGDKCEPRDA